MVEEAGKEYAEVKTAKDTDSDEFFESLGSAFSEFIAVYNKRLVFDKENVRRQASRPLQSGRFFAAQHGFFACAQRSQKHVGACRQT